MAASFSMLSAALCADSSDMFLQAYQDFQTGERMERESKPRDALDKYRSALATLEKVSKDFPDWQPLVIDYRLKKTRENITRLEPQVAALPATSDGPEGALPEADRSRGDLPTVSSEPYASVTPRSQPRRQVETPVYDDTPSRSTGSGSSSELRDLRRQMAELRRTNEELTDKLTSRTADLQSARTEVDRTKVSVVELKAQLAQANDALGDFQKDESSVSTQQKGYQQQVVALFQRLADAQADNEVLTEENGRLADKLDLASKYIITSDSIRESLLKERSTLNDARATAVARTKKIKDNNAEIERITEENQTLKTKIAKFEKGTVPKAEHDKLLAEKADLDAKYADAIKKSQDLASGGPEKDKQVASLQSELNGANDRLLEAQTQTSKSQDQVKELQNQLDETSGELAKLRINGLPQKEQQTLVAENNLLRGIILRQIKEQTHRDEAKKAIEDQVSAIPGKSDLIKQQLDVLGAPVLQMTQEEKDLFKEPVALLSEKSGESMDVVMAVSKSGSAPAPTPQPGASPLESATQDSLPADARELADKASQLFAIKNYVEAEKLYQQIVEKVPSNYLALSNLGAVQIEAGKLSAAEVALDKAIEINPNDSFAYRNLGIAYSRQGKFDQAVDQLRHAVQLSDSDYVAHNYLGVCLGQQNNPTDAEKELKRSIELNPDYSEAHFNLAVLYATLQPPSLDLAKMHYNRATQLGAPPDPSLERLIQ